MSKVLVVDDDAARGGTISQALERGGFETVWASDGNEALRAFLNELPDAVMVGPFAADPDEGFCRRLRETRPGAKTPIILYCESLRGEALKQALARSGCNVYVEFPASDERLIEVCRHSLGQVEPAFASPGAALSEIEIQGRDIDDHLDSMFSTGVPPKSHAWSAGSDLSFETDRAELPPEVFPEGSTTAASLADGVGAVPAFGTQAEHLDPDRDLIGFEPDTVSFESPIEVDTRNLPASAAEAWPVQHPVEPAGPMEVARAAVEPAAADVTTTRPMTRNVVVPEVTPPPMASLDFGLDDDALAGYMEEKPVAPAPPVQAARPRSSRGWLLGVVAAVALVGAAGLFFMLRSSSSGVADEPDRVAAARPAPPAPRFQPTAPLVDPSLPSGPAHEPVPDEAADNAAPIDETTEPPIAADPQTPAPAVAEVKPAPRPRTTEPVAAMPRVTEPTATPRPAAVIPDATASLAPPPKPHSETIFEPSTTVLDAESAGPGFTPPRVLNRIQPTFATTAVPAGGETVVLRVLVNEWGKVVRVVVEQGRLGGPLVESAVSAALDTRYRPAENQGTQVRSWARETFVFK